MATHSSILAWRIPWTEEPDGLPSSGSQRVGHNCVTKQADNWVWMTLFLPSRWDWNGSLFPLGLPSPTTHLPRAEPHWTFQLGLDRGFCWSARPLATSPPACSLWKGSQRADAFFSLFAADVAIARTPWTESQVLSTKQTRMRCDRSIELLINREEARGLALPGIWQKEKEEQKAAITPATEGMWDGRAES